MSVLVIQLVGTKGERHKTIEMPLPEGMEWPAETDTVVDFMDRGEVFLVRGLQISARNRPARSSEGEAAPDA
jgi:hypothetical protein